MVWPSTNVETTMGQGQKKLKAETWTVTAVVRGDENDYDLLLKLILVGESGTGKHSLVSRFAHFYSPQPIGSESFGIHFGTRIVELNGLRIKLLVWGPFGHVSRRWGFLNRSYYRGASGVMAVYDATKESSFEDLSYWLEEIKERLSPDTPVILVGSKCDLVEEKQVEYERAREFADERGCPLFETSAKDGTNVELAFMSLVAAAVEARGLSDGPLK